mmetsp:Transcript_17865/g.25435  ORF Transcript_17865/g.25435 Transcript_17865/m.25435 type:complete len:87 (-) Transcript_17865:1489-1749(-)
MLSITSPTNCKMLPLSSVVSQKSQRGIKYYDDLKSESAIKVIDVTYLRVLTKSSLNELKTILGVGVGIGSTQYRLSKTRPLQSTVF